MWVQAEYKAVSLFSLRSGEATATGAKTLLIPTPFAIRSALLDVALRLEGVGKGPTAFERIKGLTLAIQVPDRIAVTNLFTKVLKPKRNDKRGDNEISEDIVHGWQSTISFREYAHLQGMLGLAFEGEENVLVWLRNLLINLSYLGKRGSFFQLNRLTEKIDNLPPGFIKLGNDAVCGTEISGFSPNSFPVGLLQPLDDWGPNLTWDKVNIYVEEKISLGTDRVRKVIILPYRLVQSSRGFSYYERVI